MVITVGRKPLQQNTLIENLNSWGCGGLNVGLCQTPFVSELDKEETIKKNRHGDWESSPQINYGIYSPYNKTRGNYQPKGRHPSNFLLSANVQDTLFPYISYKNEPLFVCRVYRRILL